MVYFIRGEKTRLIKIGRTSPSCLSDRLQALKLHSPDRLELLGVIASEFDWDEKRVHVRFSHLREHGEWFREGNDLIEFIAQESIIPSKLPPYRQRERVTDISRREFAEENITLHRRTSYRKCK